MGWDVVLKSRLELGLCLGWELFTRLKVQRCVFVFSIYMLSYFCGDMFLLCAPQMVIHHMRSKCGHWLCL